MMGPVRAGRFKMNCLGCWLLVVLVASTGVYGANVTWASSDYENDTSIRDFTVTISDEDLSDLLYRINNTRKAAAALTDVGFEYGVNPDILDDWLDYWANTYNFTQRVEYFNSYPQYKTNIQGLDIHFLRITPEVSSDVEVLPLLFLHGWPGTVRELYEAIPYLTATDSNRTFALEVIAPSLPGFGFSDAAQVEGLGAGNMSVILNTLMERLGYDTYYVQGGDWGARIGAAIAALYPTKVLGFHTNMALSQSAISIAIWLAGSTDQSAVVADSEADRMYPVSDIIGYLIEELGYLHVQTTNSDSFCLAISSSPAGLLGYLLQLISGGTRKSNVGLENGGLDEQFRRDNILDIATITWFTNSFATSCRIYSESINTKVYSSSTAKKPISVPTWSIHAKNEIIYQTPTMLKYTYSNLLNATVFNDYGHFFAFEQPDVFAESVLTSIPAFQSWQTSNSNKDEL